MTQNIQPSMHEGYKKILLKIGMMAAVYIANEVFFKYAFAVVLAAVRPYITSDAAENMAIWVFNDISCYLVPAVTAFMLFRDELKENVKIPYDCKLWEAPLFYMSSAAIGSLGSVLAALVYYAFAQQSAADPFASVVPQTAAETAVFVAFTCVIGPIVEEYLFRHLLLKPLRKYGDLFAVVISTLFFGISHGNFNQLAYVMIGGFFYAVLAVRANSIKPTIAVHIINNLLVAASSYSPVEAVSAVASAVCTAVSYIGFAAFFLLAVLGRFRLRRNDFDASAGEKAALFVKYPAALIGISAMFVVFLFLPV